MLYPAWPFTVSAAIVLFHRRGDQGTVTVYCVQGPAAARPSNQAGLESLCPGAERRQSQWLKTPTALPEDHGSIPITHLAAHKCL